MHINVSNMHQWYNLHRHWLFSYKMNHNPRVSGKQIVRNVKSVKKGRRIYVKLKPEKQISESPFVFSTWPYPSETPVCPCMCVESAAISKCKCALLTDGGEQSQHAHASEAWQSDWQQREGSYVRALLTFVHIECDSPDRDPDHALWVVEKLNGLRVQGKIISVLEAWETESEAISKEDSLRERRTATSDQYTKPILLFTYMNPACL